MPRRNKLQSRGHLDNRRLIIFHHQPICSFCSRTQHGSPGFRGGQSPRKIKTERNRTAVHSSSILYNHGVFYFNLSSSKHHPLSSHVQFISYQIYAWLLQTEKIPHAIASLKYSFVFYKYDGGYDINVPFLLFTESV